MTLNEIADALGSPYAEIVQEGTFTNRKGVEGQYFTVRCGSQWFVISVPNAPGLNSASRTHQMLPDSGWDTTEHSGRKRSAREIRVNLQRAAELLAEALKKS